MNWQMQFDVDKCSVIHVGNKNLNNTYKLGNCDLRSSDKERDLGVIADNSLKFADQCNKVVKEAYSTLGLINRTIKYKSKNNILRLYKALVRPKLEYCVQAWRPFLKKDIDSLEKVQRRATKMISECRGLDYQERLKNTNLLSLDD